MVADNGRPRQVSANHRRAMAALLSEPTVKAAAKKAGLGERTLYRYLSEPEFRTELRELQDQGIAAATAALSGLVGDAIEMLGEVLKDPEASHATRVRAAAIILQERRRTAELDDLAERIALLEQVRRR